MSAGERCSDNELVDTLRLIEEKGVKGAARHLGIAPSSVRYRREQASSRNLAGDFKGGPLPPGYRLGKVTVQYDKDGNVTNEWQRQHPDAEQIEAMFKHFLEAFKQEVTQLPEVQLTNLYRNSDYLALYPIVDVHLGQHSWGKETGRDYDLKIAQDQFRKTVRDLMASTVSADTALIVVLGDYFHADDDEAQTQKSHNHLDVDGRHSKVVHVGVELIVWMADIALQKHTNVLIHVQRGNHDPRSHVLLREALWWRYQNNPRVTVDDSPEELWTFEFGAVMLSFTHGDRIKAEDMPAAMAAQQSAIFGRTTYRYAFSGHWHRSKKGPKADETAGVRWEILPAFTEKDAYNRGIGSNSLREMVSILFDKHTGRKTIECVNI